VAGVGVQFRIFDPLFAVTLYFPGVTTRVTFVFPSTGLLLLSTVLIVTFAPGGFDVTLSRPGCGAVWKKNTGGNKNTEKTIVLRPGSIRRTPLVQFVKCKIREEEDSQNEEEKVTCAFLGNIAVCDVKPTDILRTLQHIDDAFISVVPEIDG
jgi:hypothetical protein